MAAPEKIVANPFRVGGMIHNPAQFVGRQREIREILSYVAGMCSVSIYGERRIGKSSLLQQIVTTGQQRLGNDFEFFYLDLQPINSAEEFYADACRTINRNQDLPRENNAETGPTHDDLEAAIEGRKVILCLDEFEQSIDADFGAEFFNALRSLAQTVNLALVIATKRPLNEIYRQEDALTSSFSNIFTQISLGPLTDDEADEFLRASHDGFTFTKEEREFIRRIAGTHPYWLNKACAKVFDARQCGQVNFAEIERQLKAERAAAKAQPQPIPEFTGEFAPIAPAPAPKAKQAALDPNSVVLRAFLLLIIGLASGTFSPNPVGMFFAALFIGGSIALMLNHDIPFRKR